MVLYSCNITMYYTFNFDFDEIIQYMEKINRKIIKYKKSSYNESIYS